MNNIGEFLKKIREENNLTQDDLAYKFNIDRTVISKIESGRRIPTIEHIYLYKKEFNLTADELLAGCKRDGERYDIDLEKNIFKIISRLKTTNKIFFISCILFIIILFVILGCYFFTNFNKIKIYSVYSDNDNLFMKESTIIKTPSKVYFNLNFDYIDDIIKASLYYKDNDKEITILSEEGSNIDYLSFVDHKGYNGYLNVDNFNYIKDNLYLKLNDDNIKINVTLVEKNDKLITFPEKNIAVQNVDKNNRVNDLYLRIKKITNNFSEYLNFRKKINGINYTVNVNVDENYFRIYNNKEEYELYYSDHSSSILYYKTNDIIYGYVIIDEKVVADYDLKYYDNFIKLIEMI